MAPEAVLEADPVADPAAEESAEDAEATTEDALSLCARATDRRGRAARANFILILMVVEESMNED